MQDVKADIQKIELVMYYPNYVGKELIVDEISKLYPGINRLISLLLTASHKGYEQMAWLDCQYILKLQHTLLCLYTAEKEIDFIYNEYKVTDLD